MNPAIGMAAPTAGSIDLAFAPLDIPLRIHAADDAIAAALAEACRGWEGSPAPTASAIDLELRRSNALGGIGEERVSVEGSLLRIEGPGVHARADIAGRTAACAVSADYLADPALLRSDILEPLILTIASRHDRTPLHASCFIAQDLAVLLAGHSGSGKSCLALAADKAGLQLLSDDTVYVQQRPHLRVWGWPGAAHLFAADVGSAAWPTRVRNGKTKQVVPLRSASPQAVVCGRAVLCLLEPGSSVALGPMSAAEALGHLWPPEPGFDLVADEIAGAVKALTAHGAWKLTLSDDPAEAIRLVLANLPLLRATAAP